MALAGTGIRVLAITNAAVLAYVADGLGHLQIVNISTPRSAHAGGQVEPEPQPGLPRHSSESRNLIEA